MQTHVVKSTALTTIAYDVNLHRLHLKFCDCSVHTYLDVSAELYEGLLRAPSVGKYFNAHIRGQFAHERGVPD